MQNTEKLEMDFVDGIQRLNSNSGVLMSESVISISFNSYTPMVYGLFSAQSRERAFLLSSRRATYQLGWGIVWPHSHKDWRYGRVVGGGSSITEVADKKGRTGVHVLVGGLAPLSFPFLFLICAHFGRCAMHSKFCVFPTHPLRDRVA